ncbi:hypothetical protein FRC12_020852 [Ceratobasidium sp. 428]|nr:hypothetical protein FRC12_020852 [Ceratobasidium sp. 428]
MRVRFALLSVFVATTLAVPNSEPNNLSINTPAALVQCQPAQISWTAKHRPVSIGVISAISPEKPLLVDFGWQKGLSLTWSKVNAAGGRPVALMARDSTGAVTYSEVITVQKSADSSCLRYSFEIVEELSTYVCRNASE